jgi:hypothetical protein
MPSRLNKPLSDWSAADVLSLIDDRIDEGQRLDYKREIKLQSKRDRLEVAKDASGMSNAVGGVLIYGVEEEELSDGRRLPTKPTPLTDGKEESRLQDFLHSVVSPPLNYATKLLETAGGYFLVVRLQQRSGPLHMVEGLAQHRYFLRAGLSTRPMEAHEVERAFADLQGREDRLERLLRSLPLVARVAPRPHRLGGPESRFDPWISVVTAALDSGGDLLTMRPASPYDYPRNLATFPFRGERVHTQSFEIDADGYFDNSLHRDRLYNTTRLCRQGVFEWGGRFLNSGDRPLQDIPGQGLVGHALDGLVYLVAVYASVGYFGRLRLWVGIDDANCGRLVSRTAEYVETEASEIRFQSDTNIETMLDNPLPIFHAAMDRLWQGYHLPACPYFTADGKLALTV